MSASLILSLMLGSIFGLLAHSLLGRRLWQLPCYWLAGTGGFLAGEVFAVLGGVEFLRLGTIPLPGALAGATMATLICWFVTTLPGALNAPPGESRERARSRNEERVARRPARLSGAAAEVTARRR